MLVALGSESQTVKNLGKHKEGKGFGIEVPWRHICERAYYYDVKKTYSEIYF